MVDVRWKLGRCQASWPARWCRERPKCSRRGRRTADPPPLPPATNGFSSANRAAAGETCLQPEIPLSRPGDPVEIGIVAA